jgi:ABC-2 type transport system permease protein
MKRIFYLISKEFKSYFYSPIAYVLIAFFTFLSGYMFFNICKAYMIQMLMSARYPWFAERLNLTDFIIRPLYGNLSVILMLLVPIMTMRLFAEEKRQGTSELLYTSPISSMEITVGKFLSAFLLFLVMIAFTLPFPIILLKYGNPEKGVIISTYLGLILMGASFISLGTFASAITENQVIAAVVSFSMLLIFWLIGWASQAAGEIGEKVFSYLSFFEHFNNFTKGLIDTRDITYYLSFTIFGVFLTYMTIESSRWR